MDRRWLLIECNPERQSYIPLYSVCRLSRAVVLSKYGTRSAVREETFPLLHPELDTIEVLGHDCRTLESRVSMYPVVSRDTSENLGIEDLTVKLDGPAVSDEVPVYCAHQPCSNNVSEPVGDQEKWLVFGMPLERARRVVLCHDPRAPFKLKMGRRHAPEHRGPDAAGAY